MGKFVITKRANGEFQFKLKAGNGQTILASEGYTTMAACKNGIESVKKNSLVDARFERKWSGYRYQRDVLKHSSLREWHRVGKEECSRGRSC